LDILNILGNENRRKILLLLFENETHINEIARKLGISVPVVFKHITILEKNRLVERKIIGNVHVFNINSAHVQTLKKIFDTIDQAQTISIKKSQNLLDALKKVGDIGLKRTKDGYFVESIGGKKGYFLFEVNGTIPNKSLEKISLKKDSEISFYYLTPVLGRRLAINLE